MQVSIGICFPRICCHKYIPDLRRSQRFRRGFRRSILWVGTEEYCLQPYVRYNWQLQQDQEGSSLHTSSGIISIQPLSSLSQNHLHCKFNMTQLSTTTVCDLRMITIRLTRPPSYFVQFSRADSWTLSPPATEHPEPFGSLFIPLAHCGQFILQ